MKLKDGLILNQVGDDYVVVAGRAEIFKGMLKLNQSGAFIFKLMQKETSRSSIIDEMLCEYNIDAETAEKDFSNFIKVFEDLGLVEA